jgi:hypothetical protein
MKVYAQINNPILKPGLQGKTGTEFFSDFVSFLISFLILGGVLFFIVNFVLGAYKWVSSQGDKNTIDEAQNRMTYAVIGIGVIFSIFAIIKLAGFIFGIQGLENLELTIPTL